MSVLLLSSARTSFEVYDETPHSLLTGLKVLVAQLKPEREYARFSLRVFPLDEFGSYMQ